MFTDLLCHTVEVYRRTGDLDRLGQVDSNPSQVTGLPIATYPCRLKNDSGGLAMEERSLDVFVTRYTLFTDAGLDIHEDDALRVLDEAGNELLPISKIYSKNVIAGRAGAHHFEFDLLTQSGPI